MSAVQLQAFVDKWTASGASERANKDAFLIELCDVLEVPRPDPTTGIAEKDIYVFEKDAPVLHEGGATSVTKIDLYRAGHFILEAKQGSEAGAKKLGTAKRNTPGWNQAMNDAFGQALGYAKSFDEPVPFVVVCDIGYCFELYSDFGGAWQYRSFPNAQQKRIFLRDLPKRPDLVERLKKVFTQPHALDPAKHAAKITREVAAHLAELAKRLEKAGRNQISVAKFLMRCLFTMFAEDVGLLPNKLFSDYLKNHWVKSPESFPGGIESLWRAMNVGGHLPTAKVLKFNGGLFEASEALALDVEDIKLLLKAAACDWSDVEPAIFGTLLERALDPEERHRLGAHYTPRAYVERLVRPTIEEPLREEWDAVRVEVRSLVASAEDVKTPGARKAKLNKAAKSLNDYHQRLLALRILDPACGTGNFLYVAMDTLKRLESEVLAELAAVQGGDQDLLHFEGARISPEQFLGIEIKPWAKEIAELVLWIGYLQWHFKQYGKTVQVPEPVLRDYKNIECRDAVLAYDREEIVRDAEGKPVKRWDGKTMKIHPVTGKEVPDESATAMLYEYVNPRKAEWPKADFIVGNPPFIGASRMRSALVDGYVDALRAAYPDVPQSADYVMYWWNVGAIAVREQAPFVRCGLITTKAIVQGFNRRVVERHVSAKDGICIVFAIPNHPWVDDADGAQVRIAMSVIAARASHGLLVEVREDSERLCYFPSRGIIQPDFRIGVDLASACSLVANSLLSAEGVKPHGMGFVLEGEALKVVPESEHSVVRPYVNGRDIVAKARNVSIIDLHGLAIDDVRSQFPTIYQHILVHVKPERDQNREPSRKKNWWLFGRKNTEMRESMSSLSRYIGTVKTSKHRTFVFLPAKTLPDSKVIAISLEGASYLGVLQSKIHCCWALATGGRLGAGDDPTYVKSQSFEAFPFPEMSDDARERLDEIAEKLDAHRKTQQAKHADLTITGMYNVLEKLRAEEPLTAKEKIIHEQGLVSILKQLHDDLDAAVFDAYGWPHDLTDEQILERLVALNHERAEEEKRGLIRWLRPEFQNPSARAQEPQQQGLLGIDDGHDASEDDSTTPTLTTTQSWPKKLTEQIGALRSLVSPGSSWSAASAAAAFKGAKVEDVQEVMESLASLGMLIALDDQTWTAPKITAQG